MIAPPRMKKQTIAVFEALSHRTRLQIVELLCDRARPAAELARRIKITDSSMHHHLAVLRDAHILVTDGDPAVHSIDKSRLKDALADFAAAARVQ